MKKWIGFEKGINLGGWLSQWDLTDKEHLETFITEADIQQIREMGADHVRLPVDYSLLEEEDGTPKDENFIYIDRCLEWCKKAGLHMILDLHKTAGYAFDEANDCEAFFESEALQERFLCLWDKLAARYGQEPDFIALELLNEIVNPAVSDIWNALAARAIERIRRITKDTYLVVGGTRYNSVMSVKALLPPPDEKIVYTFHCYEPILFTHQGAYWVAGMPESFRTGCLLSAGACLEQSKMLDSNVTDVLKTVPPEVQGTDFFLALFRDAVAVAEERGVPLYCGEYGVIDLASPEDAVQWHQAIQEAFVQLGIGRAVWTYKALDFGWMDAHYDSVREQLIHLM